MFGQQMALVESGRSPSTGNVRRLWAVRQPIRAQVRTIQFLVFRSARGRCRQCAGGKGRTVCRPSAGQFR